MIKAYNRETLLKFYRVLDFTYFMHLSQERKEIIDEVVEKNRIYFTKDAIGLPTLMSFVAEKLTVAAKKYGLQSGDEAAYFYIKMVDPNLLFLEAFESANKEEELKNICMSNFRIYDRMLINLEKFLNKRLKLISNDDLWSRDTVDKHTPTLV